MTAVAVAGAVLVGSGAVFLFIAALGVLRMPDCYTRIQAGTKASTLGAILSLGGIGLLHPAWMGKALLVLMFVLLTNPVSSHVLARAAHAAGIRPRGGTDVDDLAAEERKGSGSSKMGGPL